MNDEGMYAGRGSKSLLTIEGLGKFGDVHSGGGQEGLAAAGSS